MNFTGCSTYTSLSGVKREMRWALPAQIAASVAGLCNLDYIAADSMRLGLIQGNAAEKAVVELSSRD